jgi:hypothetical protein
MDAVPDTVNVLEINDQHGEFHHVFRDLEQAAEHIARFYKNFNQSREAVLMALELKGEFEEPISNDRWVMDSPPRIIDHTKEE